MIIIIIIIQIKKKNNNEMQNWGVSRRISAVLGHPVYFGLSKDKGKNRCLVFLNDLVLFCSVILSL